MLFAVLALASCLTGFEDRLDARVVEMRDHEIDAFAALDAARRGDLVAVRAAGRRLAAVDEVPGLPSHVEPMLAAVRSEADALGRSVDWGDAATRLSQLAARCGSCHEALSVHPRAPVRDLPIEEAFFAVAFRDAARWRRAEADLVHLGAPDATSWTQRQEVLGAGLQEMLRGR